MYIILRVTVFLLFILSGYVFGSQYNYSFQGALIGGLLGIIAISTEMLFKKIEFGTIIGGLIGISSGLLLAYLLMLPLQPLLGKDIQIIFYGVLAVFGYGGLLLGLEKGKGVSLEGIIRLFRGQGMEENLKILDTSVIIDGRIADVCETGFIEGVFILPQFI